jgi:hypothetical protein
MKTVQDVLNSTSTSDLIEHCKDGVIENNQINDGNFSDWDSGRDIADCYLDFGGETVEFLDDNPEEMEILVKALNDWLSLAT